MSKNNYNLGFKDFLTLIFITLKLLDKIQWNWFWVLSPMLIYVGVIILISIRKDDKK